jgi:hypothetical protein
MHLTQEAKVQKGCPLIAMSENTKLKQTLEF